MTKKSAFSHLTFFVLETLHWFTETPFPFKVQYANQLFRQLRKNICGFGKKELIGEKSTGVLPKKFCGENSSVGPLA